MQSFIFDQGKAKPGAILGTTHTRGPGSSYLVKNLLTSVIVPYNVLSLASHLGFKPTGARWCANKYSHTHTQAHTWAATL